MKLARKQAFGQVAKDYKKYRGSYNKKLYEFLFSLMKEKKDVSVLDLGCGVGNSTEPIARMARAKKTDVSVFGCDPDPLMLAEARKSAKKARLPIAYVEGTAEALPFGPSEFSAVTSGAAFHWFATPKAFREIKRVLRPRGFFFVFWTQHVGEKGPTVGIELYKKYKWQGIPHKLRESRYVKGLFVKAGFKKVRTTEIPLSSTFTIREIVGLIKTNSSFALLSPADKKIFEREMTKAYKTALGKKKRIVTREEIRICYGYK